MKPKRKFAPVTTIDEAIAAFIEGARLHHAGAYLQDYQMALDGLIRATDGVDFIDTHAPTARDVLIPLLKHKEDIVQITAASALIRSHHDEARKVIDHIHATSVTEAFMSAVGIRVSFNTFGDYVMGLCRPDPRYPIPRCRPDTLLEGQASRSRPTASEG